MSEVQFAKRHIRNRFSLMVLPSISVGLWSVYENAQKVCETNGQQDQTLKTFQNLLVYIPKWDEARLNAEVDRIQVASGCSYLEELLTATLITYLRAFASVQYQNQTEIEVEFERPPLGRFIHELYKESARQCWTHAYLFKTYRTTTEQQARNRREIDTILDAAFDTTLDSFLPWKTIVDKYFKESTAPPVTIEPTTLSTKGGVQFAEPEDDDDDEETEDEDEKPALQFSDESVELQVDDLSPEDKEEEVTNLVPSDELVLKL